MIGKYRILALIVLIAVVLVAPEEIYAQCPMCKMTAESNLSNGGSGGKGLNAGILFILSLPYLIVGSIGYFWYRNRKKMQVHDQ